MDPDPTAGLPDAGPDFKEFEPQGVDLSRGQLRSLEMMAPQQKQAIGGGGQQQPELVGQEAVVTQAIGLELQFALLDAVFHLPPQDVDLVIDQLGAAPKVGDHKKDVGAQGAILHLGDEPAGPVPGVRLVAEGGKEVRFFSRLLVLPLGFLQKGSSLFQAPVIGDKCSGPQFFGHR